MKNVNRGCECWILALIGLALTGGARHPPRSGRILRAQSCRCGGEGRPRDSVRLQLRLENSCETSDVLVSFRRPWRDLGSVSEIRCRSRAQHVLHDRCAEHERRPLRDVRRIRSRCSDSSSQSVLVFPGRTRLGVAIGSYPAGGESRRRGGSVSDLARGDHCPASRPSTQDDLALSQRRCGPDLVEGGGHRRSGRDSAAAVHYQAHLEDAAVEWTRSQTSAGYGVCVAGLGIAPGP